MLMDADYRSRIADETVGKLRDMYQTIFFDAYIYKAPKVGDIGNDTWQFHVLFQVINGVYVLVELENLNGLPRVASRFVEFLHDIFKSRQAYLVGDIFIKLDLVSQLLSLIKS